MTDLVFIHSLNNFSGSPKVLSILIRQVVAQGHSVELITSGGEGFLSGIPGVKYTDNWYRWCGSRLLTAFYCLFRSCGSFASCCSARAGTGFTTSIR